MTEQEYMQRVEQLREAYLAETSPLVKDLNTLADMFGGVVYRLGYEYESVLHMEPRWYSQTAAQQAENIEAAIAEITQKYQAKLHDLGEGK